MDLTPRQQALLDSMKKKKGNLKYFYADWNSLTPDEQRILNELLGSECNQDRAIVKLLRDILDRINYLDNARHFHDPQGKL